MTDHFDRDHQLQQAYSAAWNKLRAAEFQSLLDPKHPGSREAWAKLCAFARLRLYQFQLDGRYDPAYVINSALLRAAETYKNGKTIDKPMPWLRACIVNIIRELSRQTRDDVEIDDNIADITSFSTEPDLTDELRWSRQAFEQLKPDEQKLLRLKVLKGYSWKVIQGIYAAEGQHFSTDTLRQRKARAFKRLCEVYNQFKQGN
jgi:DNA-directed RNA polymerase specialized sigma24 family protein